MFNASQKDFIYFIVWNCSRMVIIAFGIRILKCTTREILSFCYGLWVRSYRLHVNGCVSFLKKSSNANTEMHFMLNNENSKDRILGTRQSAFIIRHSEYEISHCRLPHRTGWEFWLNGIRITPLARIRLKFKQNYNHKVSNIIKQSEMQQSKSFIVRKECTKRWESTMWWFSISWIRKFQTENGTEIPTKNNHFSHSHSHSISMRFRKFVNILKLNISIPRMMWCMAKLMLFDFLMKCVLISERNKCSLGIRNYHTLTFLWKVEEVLRFQNRWICISINFRYFDQNFEQMRFMSICLSHSLCAWPPRPTARPSACLQSSKMQLAWQRMFDMCCDIHSNGFSLFTFDLCVCLWMQEILFFSVFVVAVRLRSSIDSMVRQCYQHSFHQFGTLIQTYYIGCHINTKYFYTVLCQSNSMYNETFGEYEP